MVAVYKSVCHETPSHGCYRNYLKNTYYTSFTILTKYNNINNKYITHYLGLINVNGE
jgi:hypothetical protein